MRIARAVGASLALDLADVGAGGEVATRAADQDGPACGGGRALFERFGKASEKGRVEGVPGFGPVQRELAPGSAVFNQESFHGAILNRGEKF